VIFSGTPRFLIARVKKRLAAAIITGKSLMYSCATDGIGRVRKRFFARP
jgi:hypothetical protein